MSVFTSQVLRSKACSTTPGFLCLSSKVPLQYFLAGIALLKDRVGGIIYFLKFRINCECFFCCCFHNIDFSRHILWIVIAQLCRSGLQHKALFVLIDSILGYLLFLNDCIFCFKICSQNFKSHKPWISLQSWHELKQLK